MKSRQYIIIVTVFFLSVIFQSCTKKGFLPDLEGSMVGYVYTLDEFSQLLSDHSSVLITALGKKEIYRTYSDKTGRFEFKNLPAGTYELHFEKPGFGTLKQFGIKHLGGEPTVLGMIFGHNSNGAAFFIYELPTTEINYLKIEYKGTYCECSFTKPEPAAIGIQLYFSLQDNFDLLSAQFMVSSQRLDKDGVGYKGLQNFILPFKAGDKVFFRACASPRYGNTLVLFNRRFILGIDSYFDYASNQTVYPALGKESAQFSFIVPE